MMVKSVENSDFFIRKDHSVFNDALSIVPPSWDTLLKSLDASMADDNKLTVFKQRFGFISWYTKDIPETGPILNMITEQNPGGKEYSAHLYMSISVHSEVYGRHRDTADVWYWQCQGITRWKVWDTEEKYYILRPGNWIFVPQGMDHDARPLTPRAGISFAVEHVALPNLQTDSIFRVQYKGIV